MKTLTIYHGAAKPMKAIGKQQCTLLAFAEKYRGWHSFADDKATMNAVAALSAKGYIELNEFDQFRFTYPKG